MTLALTDDSAGDASDTVRFDLLQHLSSDLLRYCGAPLFEHDRDRIFRPMWTKSYRLRDQIRMMFFWRGQIVVRTPDFLAGEFPPEWLRLLPGKFQDLLLKDPEVIRDPPSYRFDRS